MVALNFMSKFADDVEMGHKCRSIRAPRKDGRNPSAGCQLQLYTGMRTRVCRKLADVKCMRVRPVLIDYFGVEIDGRRLFCGNSPAYLGPVDPEGYDGDFAHADGFNCFQDMAEFFAKTHGLPFSGFLIEWRP